MRCAALLASTLAAPVTKVAKVSDGSSPIEPWPSVPSSAAPMPSASPGCGIGASRRAPSPLPKRNPCGARRFGATEIRTLRMSGRAIFHASDSRSANRSATQLALNSVGRNRSSVPVALQKVPSWIGLIHWLCNCCPRSLRRPWLMSDQSAARSRASCSSRMRSSSVFETAEGLPCAPPIPIPVTLFTPPCETPPTSARKPHATQHQPPVADARILYF